MLNHYFSQKGVASEQKLLDDLIIESIKINGQLVYYLPRTLTHLDPILGEDPLSKFTGNFPIEMYFDNPVGWEGEGNILSKFGMEFRKQAHFIVSRRRFNQMMRYEGNHCFPPSPTPGAEVRPMEGDLIYLPLTNGLFEILYADGETGFYEWGARYIWRIGVEKFRYSSEIIQTGIPEIDVIQTEHQNSDDLGNDPLADNDNIDNEDVDITTEDNPFGVP